MKKLFLGLIASVICLNFVSAQELKSSCSMEYTQDMRDYETHTAIAKRLLTLTTSYDALTPYVFNVKFYQINDANGNNRQGFNFTEDIEIMQKIKDLNTGFNKYNIFFKYRGFELINDDITNQPMGQSPNPANFQAQHDPQNVNINVVYCNQAYPPGGSSTYNRVSLTTHTLYLEMMEPSPWMNANQDKIFKQQILCHNMGHLLGLWHTESQPTYSSVASYYGPCEHVTRNPFSSDYNADSAGDFLVDTPAKPTAFVDYDANCNFIFNPIQLDCSPNIPLPYVNISPSNYMQFGSYQPLLSNGSCIPYYFTDGQGKRMRETILNSPTIYYGNNPLTSSLTTVESLYKPYTSSTIITGIHSIADNGNGTAKVCRNYISGSFKFQMGFDYIFPENTLPDPSNATTSDLPIVNNPPFNCPLTILQLAPGQTNLLTNDGYAETVCRGLVCVDEPFIRGTLLSTEILGSMNITIQQLSEIEVKDPELFNNLMEHYYYILKKETESGAKTEKMFYKQ